MEEEDTEVEYMQSFCGLPHSSSARRTDRLKVDAPRPTVCRLPATRVCVLASLSQLLETLWIRRDMDVARLTDASAGIAAGAKVRNRHFNPEIRRLAAS